MKRILPVDELARDERFERIRIEDVVFDPRNASAREQRCLVIVDNGLATLVRGRRSREKLGDGCRSRRNGGGSFRYDKSRR